MLDTMHIDGHLLMGAAALITSLANLARVFRGRRAPCPGEQQKQDFDSQSRRGS